jgi:hypothetical protein
MDLRLVKRAGQQPELFLCIGGGEAVAVETV